MSFFNLLFSDLILVIRIVGVGFFLRFGMYGFDCICSLLSHFVSAHSK